MEELLGFIFMIFFLAISLFALLNIRWRASAQRDETLDKQAAREEEILARQEELLVQGEETIELLKSLNENAEHRTTKN